MQGQRSSTELQAHHKNKSWLVTLYKNKKEVIHPQVPLQIPCDDLTLLAKPRFELIKNKPSSRPYSGGLTGGVCKEQGHIHRKMLTSDY